MEKNNNRNKPKKHFVFEVLLYNGENSHLYLKCKIQKQKKNTSTKQQKEPHKYKKSDKKEDVKMSQK